MALFVERKKKMSKPVHRNVVGLTKAVFFIGKIPILIDREDLWLVLRYRWSVHGKEDSTIQGWYNGGPISLAQFLMGDLSTEFDHVDIDFRNNRKINLRSCTRAQNTMNQRRRKDNSSGYRGVSWCKVCQKWRAQIQVDKKKIGLGCYTDIMDAVQAFNSAVQEYHGEFAVES